MQKTIVSLPEIIIVNPFRWHEMDIPSHISRGSILSDVLNGISSYETTKVYTDTSGINPDEEIEYNPEQDSRLDKFDAVELGFEAIEDALDSQKSNPLEKNE